ncbi:phosphoenolpyruvate synthase [Halogeometricum borinquense DSM 11551]|uniref:Phosphoenolpyruvate synthase n=1 Tax=Halogeometricum borinquense (strain ATCC 700274 / DSM 11551 / JCM 10706 / KCTC 4070 / PR3) TaxID=469382 RepID=E4NUY5_HALBP|nr:PEP/pyruvate-binding domain-containing protein [Halogeometricum borinquense]ADQ68974.1 phosphoenolpyruvate synthase/pyruvate phosphate dikinase [Halogeometricum borinquense DSM 11551]ELY29203.1 phosphoenolpyruvate synthase [Halogeometricum borinquense DSM 11551]
MSSSTSQFVVPLDGSITDPALVGGKGANLARLVDAGVSTPPALCITTETYRVLSSDKTSKTLFERLDSLDKKEMEEATDLAAELRNHLRDRPIADVIRDKLTETLDEETPYAIRSSATAEDLPHASFAGQHDSYLNVCGIDAVIEAVRDCMASLFTDRAVSYRTKNGISHRTVANAVVVQEMVDADAAGVLFTADPDSGNRTVAVIEANFGLGESVVAGDVEPDAVRVDRPTTEIRSYRVGTKAVSIRPHDDGGTEAVELDTDSNARVLRTAQVKTLVALGDRVETLFDRPQDIEWALVDGEFVVLQARPISSLFPTPTPEPSDDRLHVYVSMGHMQAFPEALPPLVRDVWIGYANTILDAFGLDPTASTFAAEAGGRIFMDFTPILRLPLLRDVVVNRLEAVNEPVAAGLRDLLARRPEAFRPELPSPSRLPVLAQVAWTTAKLLGSVLPATLVSFLASFVGEPTPPERHEQRFVAVGTRLAAGVREQPTPDARARAASRSLSIPELLADVYPRIGPLIAAFVIGGWLQRRFPDAREDVDAIGKGFERELVTRLNLGLGDLADVARTHPEVADAIRDGKPIDEVSAVDGGDTFAEAFDAYLDEFGHRATGELDLSRPRWHEDPATLLGAIRANLATEEAGEHRDRLRRLTDEAEAAVDRLAKRANHGLLGPIRARIVRRLIRRYRAYIQIREYPKHGIAHLFDAWREAYLQAGKTLSARGVLTDADDVWFLRRTELFDALGGGEPDGDTSDGDTLDGDISNDDALNVDIDARRAEFHRHAQMDAPPVQTSEGEIPRIEPDRSGLPADALVGTGVSSGVVEGVARVVFDPTEATVERGEILVAPSSDPGWTPLFLNAAGMVVEVGGRISHGALVAREYGLPAVVSVAEATDRIQTGQRVRIDGTRGIVEILDDGK